MITAAGMQDYIRAYKTNATYYVSMSQDDKDRSGYFTLLIDSGETKPDTIVWSQICVQKVGDANWGYGAEASGLVACVKPSQTQSHLCMVSNET